MWVLKTHGFEPCQFESGLSYYVYIGRLRKGGPPPGYIYYFRYEAGELQGYTLRGGLSLLVMTESPLRAMHRSMSRQRNDVE